MEIRKPTIIRKELEYSWKNRFAKPNRKKSILLQNSVILKRSCPNLLYNQFNQGMPDKIPFLATKKKPFGFIASRPNTRFY